MAQPDHRVEVVFPAEAWNMRVIKCWDLSKDNAPA
jgi:hypothetical protein